MLDSTKSLLDREDLHSKLAGYKSNALAFIAERYYFSRRKNNLILVLL